MIADCRNCDGRGFLIIDPSSLTEERLQNIDITEAQCPECFGAGKWKTTYHVRWDNPGKLQIRVKDIFNSKEEALASMKEEQKKYPTSEYKIIVNTFTIWEDDEKPLNPDLLYLTGPQ